MAGEGSLISKLDAAMNHLRTIEHERSEAVARATALEQEIKDLRGLISVAESKAEEILRSIPASAGTRSAGMAFPEPVGVAPAVDVKPAGSGNAFQEFSDKGPMQNPVDTKRRYTQVF
jgi:hypothetical protein